MEAALAEEASNNEADTELELGLDDEGLDDERVRHGRGEESVGDGFLPFSLQIDLLKED